MKKFEIFLAFVFSCPNFFRFDWGLNYRCSIICNVSFVVVVTWLNWRPLRSTDDDIHLFIHTPINLCLRVIVVNLTIFLVLLQSLYMFICLFCFSCVRCSNLYFYYKLCVLTVGSMTNSIYRIRFAYRCTGTRNRNQRIKKYTAVQHTMLLGM